MKKNFIFIILLSQYAFSQTQVSYNNFASAVSSSSNNWKLISSVGEIFTGTHSSTNYSIKNGAASIFDPIVVSVEENLSLEVIKEFNLLQNYPNPFNPLTKIQFDIPHQDFISLKIYDITGKEIESLINGELPSGRYLYEWDSGGLASGVYLYRLKANNFVQTRKLILLK